MTRRRAATHTETVTEAGTTADLDAMLDDAIAACLAERDPTDGFAAVAANAMLGPIETIVLGLAVAIEMDVPRQLLLADLQGQPERTRLMVRTVRDLLPFGDRSTIALGADAGPRRAALVSVSEDGPWAQHTVAVHPGVIWAIIGDPSRDAALPLDARIVDIGDVAADGTPRPPAVSPATLAVVSGHDQTRRRQRAMEVLGGNRFVVTSVPSDTAGWEALIRESTICGASIVVEMGDEMPPETRRWIDRTPHLSWALSSKLELPLDVLPERPRLEVQSSTQPASDAEWHEAFGSDAVAHHRLSARQVELVRPVFEANGGDLDAAVRRLVSGPLERLATRITATRTWDDLVLTSERKLALREVVNRYRHSETVYDQWGFSAKPSRGQVALFSGASGTGKTLAAEIIAGELSLDLFKLNLSSVVSKYIGETEKNLDQIFDAAEAGSAVVFFDEADSLFGKRSEVKDAHDRYANIETSYLLQRLERYDGVVVLATNFEKNIDAAFLRRIHTRVEFTLPEAAERRAIWAQNLPATAPQRDVDLDLLSSRFELSGGSIRNVTIFGAFIAASRGEPITTEVLVFGVARELSKQGRLITSSMFGELYDMVVRQSTLGA